MEVAHHYEQVGGRSPLNELTYKQADKLKRFLDQKGYDMPVLVGMRHWHPFIKESVDTISKLEGSKAVGVIMALHQSDTSWEKYMRDVEDACLQSNADVEFVYTDPLYRHPKFIESSAGEIKKCFELIPEQDIEDTRLVFTAHSIPLPMAEASPYVSQFETSCRLVAERLGHENWTKAYQSRSGSPSSPWLEPDICDVIADLAEEGVQKVVVQAIGFVCDHVEVLFDIGIEAREEAEKRGIDLYIAKTVNDNDLFISAIEDEVVRVLES